MMRAKRQGFGDQRATVQESLAQSAALVEQKVCLGVGLDTLGNAMQGSSEFDLADKCQQDAYEMMFGEARSIFDLSTEKKELRDSYGRSTFGQLR